VKVIGMKDTSLAECVAAARHGRVVITQKGKPVALIIGVAGKDLEQIDLGSDDQFWELIESRRHKKTISRSELSRRLAKNSR
jgi:antitoxin (DNA-binding transcriptional repressor) of toxin-antitoxin stability system